MSSTKDVGLLRRVAPIVNWLPGYRKSWLPVDALAGLAVAAVAIPTAMGYSAVALVPVQIGLYALPAAFILYAIFGSSRQLVIGPSSTVALMSGAVVAALEGIDDPARVISLTAAVALASGLWLAAFGFLRLGWVTDFISRPVIVGFSFGLGLTVLAGELPHLLGLGPEPPHFTARVIATLEQLGDADLTVLLIGVVVLAVLFIGQAKLPRVPWALIVIVASVIAAGVWDARADGVEVLGSVPSGLPPIAVPSIGLADLDAILLGGLAVAVAGVGEGLAAARIYSSKGGYRVNSDSEFLGSGMANIGAGLSSGMAVCGSLSRTGTAAVSGTKTQVMGLFAALVTVVFLLTMTGLMEGIPRVVLSGIIVISVWGLLDVRAIAYYRRVRRNDFVASMTGLGGVLLLGPLYGLLTAVGISLLGLAYRSSKVNIDVLGKIPAEKAAWGSVADHPERVQTPGVLVLRLDAPLFWANCEAARQKILEMIDATEDVQALVLDLEASGQMDTTATESLSTLQEDLRMLGIELFIARLHHAPRRVLRRAGFTDVLGPGHAWHSISQAIRAAKRFLTDKPLPEGDLFEQYRHHEADEALPADEAPRE
jgi:high affinity sulfate transporter 1